MLDDSAVPLRCACDGVLRDLRVRSAPVEGPGNQAVCRLVAEAPGVARTRVSPVSGDKGRDRTVVVSADETIVRAGLLNWQGGDA